MRLSSFIGLAWLPAVALACEPAALDGQALMQTNDHNRDGALQRSELAAARFDGSGYDGFEADPSRPDAFARLDKNGDGKLSGWGEGADELGGLYRYLPNPCAGWPWGE